jgi:glycosyltransferase involved in cell wall biosynthesis
MKQKDSVNLNAVTVVIPAYNEEKTIADVVKRVAYNMPHATILVIDDGSSDSTAELARSAGALVISHPVNKGNGASMKTALRAIEGGIVAVIDADGQHDPADLPKLIQHLEKYDLVVGARSFVSEQGSWLRNIGNIILSRLAGFLAEQQVPDLTCGLRVFKHSIATKFLHVYPNGYSFPSTTTLCFITAGYNVHFEPVSAKHRKPNTKSNLRPFRDGFKFLSFIMRIISLTNPNKIFFPTGLFLLICGILLTIRNLVLFAQFSGGTVLFLAGGINIIFFGLILDQFAALRIQERE